MKKHAIIPIFLPHKGCPNDCVFCNQKVITAKLDLPKEKAVINMIEQYLATITARNIETVEIAFFGGSFTGIPIETQRDYLQIAKGYKEKGQIHKIRLSTRPDYINDEILILLKEYLVDIIELGVQSFDDEVLRLSNRGHSSGIVYKSSELIKNYGFELGIQLMVGLPGDTYEKDIESVRKTIEIKPSIARIYPTLIIKDTELEQMYFRGDYKPLGLKEAVSTAKDMYLMLKNAGINVIRIGLKSTDHISEGKQVIGNNYHPAFRQLVESEIIKDQLESRLTEKFQKAVFYSNNQCFSNMLGNKKSNKQYFETKYQGRSFEFKIDDQLENEEYRVQTSL